jgi:hypothetical protein
MVLTHARSALPHSMHADRAKIDLGLLVAKGVILC